MEFHEYRRSVNESIDESSSSNILSSSLPVVPMRLPPSNLLGEAIISVKRQLSTKMIDSTNQPEAGPPHTPVRGRHDDLHQAAWTRSKEIFGQCPLDTNES